MNKGKLVVIEGTDGSGKTTQLSMAVGALEKQGVKTAVFDFPQYEKTFFGKFVKRFLTGEFGGLSDIDPYLASFPYAFDRWQAGEDIRKELVKGKMVFCNRFTGSSMAHQTSKLQKDKQKSYLDWVQEMEFEVLKTPKPDLVIFLHVDPELAYKLMKERNHLTGRQLDIAESNLGHQKETEKIYLQLAKNNPEWEIIECVRNGKIMSREEIHRKVMGILSKRLKVRSNK